MEDIAVGLCAIPLVKYDSLPERILLETRSIT